MKGLLIFLISLVIIAVLGYIWINYRGVYYANKPPTQNIVNLLKPGQNQTEIPLKIPSGYNLSIYTANLNGPRVLTTDPNGNILVSEPSAGKIIEVNGNAQTVVASGLNLPHGLAFSGTKLYVAETDGVSVWDYDTKSFKATNKQKIIDIPGGGEHFTRTLLIKDNKLYVSIGSDCNACSESDPRRAAIWRSNLDGSQFSSFSSGLRNAVFLHTNPSTNEIWATTMGRDFLGDNLPPDTMNIIKQGANYGWPYCYGNKVTDNETNPGGSKFDCSKMEPPKIEIPAHSAPLGFAFLGSDVLIAYHGSWNRSVPTGYKVVKYSNGVLSDFITGWLQPDGNVLGRPVDILIKGTDIYISDDKSGVIYLLSKI